MFKCRDYNIVLGRKTYVMGILNYTPDSFSDGGEHFGAEQALECALKMQEDGADIIDLGANSTRPGAVILTDKEEQERLREVLEVLQGKLSVPLSVDTFYPGCAKLALEKGASIINDVSGTFNTEIAELVKEYNAGYIVMHNPCGAGEVKDYPEGVVPDVRSFFMECIGKASEMGFPKSNLCLDPGFGFGKTNEDNIELLRNLEWAKFNGTALLSALSRKRFIGEMSNVTDAKNRDAATMIACSQSIAAGADIIRVHNVPMAVQCALTADRIYRN